MNSAVAAWHFWAILSATFAALKAITAKVGIDNTNSDFAKLIRTVVIFLMLSTVITATG